jgi:hypothetical protein
MKRFASFAITIATLATLGIWWFSPEQVIKRRCKTLLNTLTLEATTGIPGRHMKTYQLNSLLANEVTLENPTIREAQGTFDRADLESGFSWLCNQAKQTHFKLERFHKINVTGNKATVELTLTALVELPTYRPADGSYDATFEWIRDDDAWQLTRANWKNAP